MANELYIASSAAVSPYAILRRKSDLRVASIAAEAFVTFADADLDDYVVSLISAGGDVWAANFPAWISQGEYLIHYYSQAGDDAATSDVKIKEADLYWTGTATAPGEDPTAAEMVSMIKRALRDAPADIVTITRDGNTTTWDRAQAISELKYWTKLAAAESGTRPRVMSIRLDRGYSD